MKTRSVRSTVLRELPAAPTIGDKRATVRPHGGKGMPRDLDPGVVAAMYEDYQGGLSLADVGVLYGRTRQSIYEIFKTRGLKLRTRTLLPAIEVDGRKFTEQRTGGRHRYLRDTCRGRKHADRTIYLHHLVWERAHGPIPAGHKLAFKDGNHLNVALENLELLTNSEQVRKYAAKGANGATKTAPARLSTLLAKHRTGGSLGAQLKRRGRS